MALKFEIDQEAFDALAEGQQELYEKKGDGYQLQVEGIDDGAELKEALRKEREERAAAKSKLSEFEKNQQEAERKRMEERQEYENLYKTETEKSKRLEQEHEELKRSIAQKERIESARQVVTPLATDPARGEILRKEAMDFIHHTPEGIKINGPDGEAWDASKLSAYLKERYPFLVDGSKANGGGAAGGKGGGATGKKFNEMSGAELSALRRDDPSGYDRLKNEFYS